MSGSAPRPIACFDLPLVACYTRVTDADRSASSVLPASTRQRPSRYTDTESNHRAGSHGNRHATAVDVASGRTARVGIRTGASPRHRPVSAKSGRPAAQPDSTSLSSSSNSKPVAVPSVWSWRRALAKEPSQALAELRGVRRRVAPGVQPHIARPQPLAVPKERCRLWPWAVSGLLLLALLPLGYFHGEQILRLVAHQNQSVVENPELEKQPNRSSPNRWKTRSTLTIVLAYASGREKKLEWLGPVRYERPCLAVVRGLLRSLRRRAWNEKTHCGSSNTLAKGVSGVAAPGTTSRGPAAPRTATTAPRTSAAL